MIALQCVSEGTCAMDVSTQVSDLLLLTCHVLLDWGELRSSSIKLSRFPFIYQFTKCTILLLLLTIELIPG